MNRKKSILISLTGITVVMLALLGLTYGYYITNIIGNTNSNSISIDTKDLKLEYNDGTEDLVFGAIEPGWSNEDSPKVFTVNNIGKSNIDEYAVGIDEVINELNRTEDLTYTITCKSYLSSAYEANGEEALEAGVCRGDSGEFPKENSLILTNQIDSGYIHVYEMIISYKYLDDVNQSEDMGASVGGRIQIYTLPDTIDITGTVANYSEGDYVEINSVTKTSQIVDGKYKLIGVEPGNHTLSIKYIDDNDVVQTRSSKQISIKMGQDAGIDEDNNIIMNSSSGNVTINIDGSSSSLTTDITGVTERTRLLKDEIIANAVKNTKSNSTTGTIFSPTPLTTPGQVVSGETERTLSITVDDYGNSYYFRGNVIDNYVNFAGMCWRIVRVQGDGSIKLILEDDTYECNNESYTGNWSIGYGDYGYGYIDGKDYPVANYLNPLVAGMADAFKNYQTTLEIKLKAIDENKTLSNTLKIGDWCYDATMTEISTTECSYGSAGENVELCEYGTYAANTRIRIDKTPSLNCTGENLTKFNDDMDMYVGTITADEAAYAGTDSEYIYLVNEHMKKEYEEAELYNFWTLSPSTFYEDCQDIYPFFVEGNGLLSDWIEDVDDFDSHFRPAITLKNGTTISIGEGTQSNPYVIE